MATGTPLGPALSADDKAKLDELRAWVLDAVEDDPVVAVFGSTVAIFPGSGTLSLTDIADLVSGPVTMIIVVNQSGGTKNIGAVGGWNIGGSPPPYAMPDNSMRMFVPDALSPKWAIFSPAAF